MAYSRSYAASKTPSGSKRVTLALQGGGSHGAFTWGVLDRLLEDERIEIEGISGASAGAINAAVLAHGLTTGGRAGAREALKAFWGSVASRMPFGIASTPWHTGGPLETHVADPATKTVLFLSRFFSPYQLNPFNLNPLRDMLAAQLDFERIRANCPIKLFVAATHVATGRLRLFSRQQLSLDALLASACIPSLNHPVEIDGETYWDGGLTANPPLRALLYECDARDILVVLLHPLRRKVPATAEEITHRLTEISFGSAFCGELQGIAHAKKEAESAFFAVGRLERRLRRLNLHLIESEKLMSRLSVASRLSTHAAFLEALRDEGRRRAHAWLRSNFQLIGARSSLALGEHLT